ncbi:MAG: acyl--CoA ligase [Betaproteobacteria bacterium]|nr:acyl--CoA ligase [Betaproteobacteria bacterium]
MSDLPFATVPDLVRRHARARPAHPALIQDAAAGLARVDYATLDALMDRVAARLQQEGVRPRDAVAVCAANSIEYAALFLGALRAGAAVAPLAPGATPESIARMRADSGAKMYFGADDLAGIAQWPQATPAPVAIQPDWPFNIIYSSGTTGEPKGIVQPHAMRWSHVQRSVRTGYGPDAVTLVSTPLYSNTTLVSFIPTIALGGTAILMAKFDVRAYLELAQKYRVTHSMLVPVQYQRFMAFPDFDRYDLSSFRVKTATSAPFPATLKAEVVRRWPGRLVDSYGLTEGGGTCLLDCGAHPDKLHTVGLPAPGHDIRLIDDAGNELPPGTGAVGEIVGHSSGMMSGYHNQPRMTRDAFWHDASGKPFIRTGDIGRFDDDGFLVLVDRKKDMIISGGFNVYPSDLEGVLAQSEHVAEASVVGVPSEQWGETPVAFVVLRAPIAAGALLDWANARLGKTQRIAALEIVGALPRSPIGKVLKRELRDRYVQGATR